MDLTAEHGDVFAAANIITDRFRHTADDHIVIAQLQCLLVDACGKRQAFPVRLPDGVQEQYLPACREEFLKVHREHVQDPYFPDRERGGEPVDFHAEQAPCRNDPVILLCFAEVFQRSDGPFTNLNLIQYDRRFLRDCSPSKDPKVAEEHSRRKIPVKSGLERRLFLQVDIEGIFITFFTEVFDQPGFADLAYADEHQRFLDGFRFPLGQFFK